MGINDWTESDKQLFAVGSRAALDDLARQAEEWRSTAALDTTSTDEMVRQHNQHVRELEEQHRQWLTRFLNGDDNATTDVAAGGLGVEGASPAAQAGSPVGHTGPRQQPIRPDPREAGLTAQDIASMSMADYEALRTDLGIGAASNTGLFG